MKILLAPNSTGGHLWGLHSGLDEIGIKSDVLYYQSSKFNFPSTKNLQLERYPATIQRFLKFINFPKLYSAYDIFHYNDGMPLLPYFIDLQILNNKKKIFVTFNGTSSRLKEYALKYYKFSQFAIKGELINSPVFLTEKQKVRRIQAWERYATKIFCLNPDLCNTCQNSVFLPYAKPGFNELNMEGVYGIGKKIRIGHCPTNRTVKGTKFVLEAINKLESKYNIELVLIEDVDNKTAKQMIQNCDFIIDQLLVGWYGGIAIEAMKMGKPVIAYIRKQDLIHVPVDMREEIPIINANPDSILPVLENILENPGTLSEISQKSLDYVNKYHNPVNVAKKVLEIYNFNGD